ncbi:OVARIAN TUMOR DOMAIN-containing deubiquitinating enzyme 10-like isoform X2 [Benincasa hispida]|uniref:OVARIAN TUMOR DOMAIN-containing deubiquitinating enzyme 10-like isoform X2 n=1 Tax=Benincasa hispida TaxID=102211 RepID=UPI001901723E|nr:OVARIAN TUMOR DOMAIN-containing deubiquitinating enzyme 10-like isoform X2 [Benincasa hispida]
MVPSGYESDVIQWGLRLFDGDSVLNSGYYGEMTAVDDHYPGNYYRDHYNLEPTCVENDEIIARTLQENLSHLSITDSSRCPIERDEQLRGSIYTTAWHNPFPRNNSSERVSVQEDIETMDPSSSCSSPGDEDFSYLYAVDGEEFWRFNQMIPVPHVPRINGEIPSVDEAASDHERLLNRLQVYDFVERKVQGDGNCQFRALSDQLYGTPDNHELVRQKVVNQLMSHPEIYEGYVPMAYDDYLEKMSRNGEWGDHVTLQAAVDSYCVQIFLITSFKDTCCIEILPNSEKTKGVVCLNTVSRIIVFYSLVLFVIFHCFQVYLHGIIGSGPAFIFPPRRFDGFCDWLYYAFAVIFLSFWAEVHYNSIHPQGGVPSTGDSPPSELRKKKRWWKFGNKH